MRTLISSIFLCLFVFPVLAQHHAYPCESSFSQVRAAGNIQVLMVAADVPGIFLDSKELPGLLKITNEDGKLILRTPTELQKGPAVRVRINYSKITKLEVSRGAVLRSPGIVKCDTLGLKADFGGKVELQLACDTINIHVSQGGNVVLYGKTRSQAINASTGASYQGYGLDALYAWVRAGSASQVKVNASALLNARSSGKAFVAYRGSPAKTTFNSNMGGEITRQTE